MQGIQTPASMRGYEILEKFLMYDFQTVLDVGAGALQHSNVMIKAGKTVDTIDYGMSTYYDDRVETKGVRNTIIGDFNNITFPDLYDAVWCSHILEHQLNPNLFLKKLHSITKEGGYVAIVVPPRKPFIVDGHVSLWNAGLVLYHLVLAGFDCSEECFVRQYDYNIGIIVKKRSIPQLLIDLCMDTGDIEKLKAFFPPDLGMCKNFNGDIMNFPKEEASSMKVAILIPSRFGSTRLPGKALVPLNGIPLAKLVYDKCSKTGLDTYLLSDDERVCALAENSMLTSESCENGTERCAEAAERLPQYDAFINCQGDMPDITTDIIMSVVKLLERSNLASVYTDMSDAERSNPNSVKLIHNGKFALWSCRAALSYGDHHLGVYGYRPNMLKLYRDLPVTKAEKDEGLEQLRWMSAGIQMHVDKVDFDGHEINTPEDLAKWEARNN
jgi:CMP-2-keto-3-deoxyoctulosonic acid synthetase